MSETETNLTREQEEVIDDIVRHLAIKRECLELMTVALTDWPEGIAIYYIFRKDRHGRIFYHYLCYEGEVYSPFTPDGLELLLKRLLSSRRFTLTAEQLVNIILMYKRPEPLMTIITDVKKELSASSRHALEYYYGLTDLSAQLTRLEEDYKVVFWTLNFRRETLKRWNAFIYEGGRLRLTEDVVIELRDARAGQQ
ncbi:MAG: hypothetical protein J0M03_15630 [Acidobacteria bacterium]|nr:hypothetical protein [Acidobacteriota bacterium]